MNFIKNKILIIVLISLSGCSNEKGKSADPIVAQVLRKTLTLSELREEITLPLDKKDSALMAKEYIDSWIKQQLLVAEAESKLSSKEQKIDKEIELYRNELLIYKFKNKLMQEIIDEPVSDKLIEEYYRNNLNKYILNSPIVKVRYIIFPSGLNVPDNIIELLPSKKLSDISKSEDFIFKYAKKYDDFEGHWIYLDKVLNSVNFSGIEIDELLKNHKTIQKRVKKELHVIAITDYHLSGDQAPISLVEPQIRSTIINNKKQEFLREIKDSLYKDALKYNKFRVYN